MNNISRGNPCGNKKKDQLIKIVVRESFKLKMKGTNMIGKYTFKQESSRKRVSESE